MITSKLEVVYDHITEGIRVQSKCNWYEYGKKSTNFFLNLGKNVELKTTFANLYLMSKK